MRITQLTYLLFFVGTFLFVSCQTATLHDARAQYLRGEYFAASQTYRNVYRNTKPDERPLRGVIAYEMAETYRRLNYSARAATAYANAIRYNYPDTLMYLRYAQMLHKEGKYAQAQTAYADFLSMDSLNFLALNGLRGARDAEVWRKTPTRYSVKRMDVLNSNRAEFSPMLAENDAVLYFASSRNDARGDAVNSVTGMKNNDFFLAKKNDKGAWQKAEILDWELNTEFDEGTPSFTADEQTMYYTFSPVSENQATTTQIYTSKKVGGSWTAGQLLEVVKNDSLSLFAHPAVSPSGDYLYFVSDMPGGYGGKDIWRAGISKENTVLFVENLGNEINTPGDEMFPYMRNDSTLYFSSDGHPGMGGLDIFKAVKREKSNDWHIQNLRYPMNSSADDFGITFAQNKESGFFSSNRNDARGYDHIYFFEYPDVNVVVEGLAVDKEDTLLPGVSVTVIGTDGSQQHFVTDEKGTYRFAAERNVEYVFMAAADGFLNMKKSLRTAPDEKDSLYYVDFELTPYNKPVILENIFYDFDKATLRPESKEELDGLILLLNENPEIAIELSAHTDRKGSEEYNNNLSLRRAQSVTHYLISQGIDEGRLQSAGYGKSQPKAVTAKMAENFPFLREGEALTEEFIETLLPEEQEIADQINRRTEFKIIDTTFGLF